MGMAACALVICAAWASVASAVVPDNGSGTAHIPIRDTYVQTSDMQIINGLAPGSTIDLSGVLSTPTNTVEQPGGTLGGRQGAAVGAVWQWNATGTGAMLGYNRVINLALDGGIASFPAPPNAGVEVHAAPNTPFAPVQAFNTDMYRMFGQTITDPDFDLLRFSAGTDFGLPSPGVTVLTQSGTNWDVLSYFDLTYRIDFVGKAGGPLGGRSGSSTGTVRILIPEPATSALLVIPALAALARRGRRRAAIAPAVALH
jgi:hypothetical protein